MGLFGAGRTRNGLGPFLAACCERAGLLVRGVAGRDVERAQVAAAALAAQLGHPVAAHGSVEELARSGLDALVVAVPVAQHLRGLEAALGAGIACLCEKPLVDLDQFEAGRSIVAAFAAKGLLLVENCQWPCVLPAFDRLWPGRSGMPREVVMGLAPAEPGIAMVHDALPHLLSVVQAVLPAGSGLQLERARYETAADGRQGLLELALRHMGGLLRAELHLRTVPQQPRPAWLAIDGRRIDRRIDPGYRIVFCGGGRESEASDPLQVLVSDFAVRLGGHGPADAVAAARCVAERLGLYAATVAALSR